MMQPVEHVIKQTLDHVLGGSNCFVVLNIDAHGVVDVRTSDQIRPHVQPLMLSWAKKYLPIASSNATHTTGWIEDAAGCK